MVLEPCIIFVFKEQLLYTQEINKQKELLYAVELEKERRRQHMILVRALENRKRIEERERKRIELRAEKIAKHEKKLEQRRIELELLKELRRPTEDMELEGNYSRGFPGGTFFNKNFYLRKYLTGVYLIYYNINIPSDSRKRLMVFFIFRFKAISRNLPNTWVEVIWTSIRGHSYGFRISSQLW